MLAARFSLPGALRTGTRALRPAFRSQPRLLCTSRIQRPSHACFRSQSRCRPRVAEQAWDAARHSEQRRYRQAFNYQRFSATKGLFYRWAVRPTFYYEVAGIAGVCVVFYVTNLEEVPVSGRRRFNIVPNSWEAGMGRTLHNQTMQEFGAKILPPSHPAHRMVQRVLDRLIPHSRLEGDQWEVHVINDDMANAFVIPGGKVFVFSGILDLCQNEDGLATVLGHEIAHNVAHHAAERMSQSGIVLLALVFVSQLVGVDIGISRLLADLMFTKPGSRAQEAEADYIGLLMMAEACFDPAAAIGVWSRMEQEEKKAGVDIPQFMSTHPSSHNRLEKMKAWMMKAEAKREESGCSSVGGFVDDFRGAVPDFARWQ